MTIKAITSKIMLGLTTFLAALGIAACGVSSTQAIDIVETTSPTTLMESKDSTTELASKLSDLTIVDDKGNTTIDADALETALSMPSSTILTDIEVEGLLFMREEEKLARDVYLTLHEQWKINIFQNIAASEQTHTDAVKALLYQYGLDDPVVDDEIGVFTNPDLQALYDQLVLQGSQSLGDALNVGAAIEEIDILDLEEYVAQTDNADIQMVYENLMKGSRNHLRSFVSTIQKQTGLNYQPQYLSQDAYQVIVGSEIESGGRGRGKGNG